MIGSTRLRSAYVTRRACTGATSPRTRSASTSSTTWTTRHPQTRRPPRARVLHRRRPRAGASRAPSLLSRRGSRRAPQRETRQRTGRRGHRSCVHAFARSSAEWRWRPRARGRSVRARQSPQPYLSLQTRTTIPINDTPSPSRTSGASPSSPSSRGGSSTKRRDDVPGRNASGTQPLRPAPLHLPRLRRPSAGASARRSPARRR